MPALEALLLPEAEKLSAVILVMMDWDPARADLVAKLKAHGVAVRVLLLRAGLEPRELEPQERVALA